MGEGDQISDKTKNVYKVKIRYCPHKYLMELIYYYIFETFLLILSCCVFIPLSYSHYSTVPSRYFDSKVKYNNIYDKNTYKLYYKLNIFMNKLN